ncbi:MAG: TetR family transcriptional regulator, partial [Gammaproteobacteria bacterium]
RNHRDHLLAEQAFLQAAIADPRLRAPALAFRRSVVDAIVEFFGRLGTAAPAEDAELVYATFMQLEYEHLLKEPGVVDRARIESVIGHHFALVFR